MKSYNVQPDLTSSGLGSLANCVRRIMNGDCNRVELGNGTMLAKIPSNDQKQYTIVITMDIEEEK